MNNNTLSLAGLTVGVLLGVAIVLAVLWVLWLIWCLAVPAFFPVAPPWLAEPSYWAFVGIYTLIRFIGRAIFGGARSKD